MESDRDVSSKFAPPPRRGAAPCESASQFPNSCVAVGASHLFCVMHSFCRCQKPLLGSSRFLGAAAAGAANASGADAALLARFVVALALGATSPRFGRLPSSAVGRLEAGLEFAVGRIVLGRASLESEFAEVPLSGSVAGDVAAGGAGFEIGRAHV